MASSLSKKSLELIGGLVAIVVVLGAAAYMYLFMAAVPASQVPATSYPAESLVQETKEGGVFDAVPTLKQVPASQPSAIQFSSSDVGKTDISKPE